MLRSKLATHAWCPRGAGTPGKRAARAIELWVRACPCLARGDPGGTPSAPPHVAERGLRSRVSTARGRRPRSAVWGSEMHGDRSGGLDGVSSRGWSRQRKKVLRLPRVRNGPLMCELLGPTARWVAWWDARGGMWYQWRGKAARVSHAILTEYCLVKPNPWLTMTYSLLYRPSTHTIQYTRRQCTIVYYKVESRVFFRLVSLL